MCDAQTPLHILHQEGILSFFFYSELKRKTYKRNFAVKARNNHHVNVLKPYLFVLVCFLLELHWHFKLFSCKFFFFNILVSKLGV